jgi:hypothetical protein
MSKVITFRGTDCLSLPVPDMRTRRNAQGLSTADFRRLLSELKHRPPSQRAFLRKLLSRAIATRAPIGFPAVNHAVRDPVSPS